jgi:hypothetical protein
MTGPPYPRYAPGAGPGQNAIGSFVIGVSPLGTISAFDVWTTVISQYANSAILTRLVTDFAQYVDQTKDFDQFFDLMWNVDTAQGYGLDAIGRKVNASRTVNVPGDPTFFGFEEAGAPAFGGGTFFSGGGITRNFLLSDEAYRTLIFAKALANISDGSIPSANQILLNLFKGRGNCYVTDGLDMTITYTFEFALTPVELAIVSTSGILPTPAGVSFTIVVPVGT